MDFAQATLSGRPK